MRKTKEEKVIAKSYKVLQELVHIYKDGLGVKDFQYLLEEYKKLNRRYIKTIKLSDKMGHGIIKENSKLSDNLEYTVKTARSKILENITQHRKTKEKSSFFEAQLKRNDLQINILKEKNANLEKKLKLYERKFGSLNKAPEVIQVKEEEKKFEPLIEEDQLRVSISNELEKDDSFYLCKISLKNLAQMTKNIEKITSMIEFSETMGKFLRNNLMKDDIVINYSVETFYLIIKREDEDKVVSIITNLNKKRIVLDLPIEFIIGFTKCNDNRKENYDTVIKRCNAAYTSAKEKDKIVLK